ncbi:MAG TPA: tetratricopeptide repeat protein [Alphaproteobacteria bacterium]|jgi:tetratricopeptide (TPR) repeat protein|nr:tetratricopeptide repeat protein [Alphaproteobacteria bacterium]
MLYSSTMMSPTRFKSRFGVSASLACVLLVAACSQAQTRPQVIVPTEPLGTAGGYLAARHAQLAQDTRLAADLYGKALAEDPDNPELQRRTFQLLAADGRFDEGVPIARQITATTPNAALPLLTLIVEDVRQRRYADASTRINALPGEGLTAFVRPIVSAWVEAGRGNKVAAETALKDLASKSGFELFAYFHTALVDDLLGDTDGARLAYAAAVDVNKAQFVRVTEAAGSFYERTGDRAAAQKLYESYERAHPDTLVMKPALERLAGGSAPPRTIASVDAGLAEGLFDIASLLHQERIDDVGIILGQLALRLRPDFTMAKLLIADIYEAQGHIDAAINAYQSVDPNAPVAWSARLRSAVLLATNGNVDASVRRLEAMADERPERPDALVALGDVLRTSDRYSDAVAAYDRALERIPHLEERHWAILYSRGMALERAKQWPRAEADFLKAIQLSPDQPYLLNYLAYSWTEQGTNLDRAQGMLERALKLRPKDPQIIDSMGWVQYRLGHYDNAVKHLEQAVELKPQDAVINDHLGDAYWRVGRYNEARYQWQRALRMDPEPNLVASLESKLQNGLKPSSSRQGVSRGTSAPPSNPTARRGS